MNPCQGHAVESAKEEGLAELERLVSAACNLMFDAGILRGRNDEHQDIEVKDARAARAALMAHVEAMCNVPKEAIGKLLSDAMDVAAANGANSVSMPDEYVEVAAWLCGIKPAPQPCAGR